MLPRIPSNLSLASTPTPLRLLTRASKHLGGPNIWLKCDDLTSASMTGNKVRKLEFLLADAIDQGADTIITCGGLQSNHCRAAAIACAQLGLKCILILRDNTDQQGPRTTGQGNFLLDQLVGADIKIIDAAHYQQRLPELFKWFESSCIKEGGTPYSIPTGGSSGVGLWGYLTAFEELKKDFIQHQIQPEYIFCASGSGGTQAGLTLGAHLNRSPASIIGVAVCDSVAYFDKKIKRDIAQWRDVYFTDTNIPPTFFDNLLTSIKIKTLDQYIGPGYALPYDDMLVTLKWLAQTEGVILDPVYTGKAFHGMLCEIQAGRFADAKDIVFVHTGGIFGTFPYASSLI